MSSSTSSPTNTTSTTTNAQETNQAATNTQGVTVVGSEGTNLTSNTYSTDDGAVAAGTALGQSAIAANTGLSESLASDYENEVETSATQSTNLVSSALTQGFNFLATENNTISNIEQQNATSQSQALGNYAQTLSSIATAQDTSESAQNTAFLTSTLKIAAVVVLGIAVIFFATRKG